MSQLRKKAMTNIYASIVDQQLTRFLEKHGDRLTGSDQRKRSTSFLLTCMKRVLAISDDVDESQGMIGASRKCAWSVSGAVGTNQVRILGKAVMRKVCVIEGRCLKESFCSLTSFWVRSSIANRQHARLVSKTLLCVTI